MKDSDQLTGVTPATNESVAALKQHNRLLKRTLDQLLSNANKNQRTQEKFYQLELHFLQANSFEELVKRILIDLKQKFSLSAVKLYLYDPNEDIQQLLLEIYDSFDFPALSFFDDETELKAYYPDKLKIQLTQDDAAITGAFGSVSQKFRSAALLPLRRGKQLFGSLHLASDELNRFSPALESHFLEHLASIITVCIENSLNQERFKHLSLVDMLTRVKNRRYFFQALARELARTIRAQQSIACLFIDVDHFKQINDQFGHETGDHALKQVAQVIQCQLRQSDLLARFGGEEFTVLLPNTSRDDALDIAERIRNQVARNPITLRNAERLELRISIGVSYWQANEQQTSAATIQEQLIQQADKAVYRAKSSGRNCVKLFS